MSKWIYLATSLVVTVVLNLLVIDKERILDQGDIVRLELRPRDPRSLMQGDFMMLAYALAQDVPRVDLESVPHKGRLVVTLDANRVASFARFDDGSPIQQDEHRLVYYKRDETGSGLFSVVFSGSGTIWPGPNAWLFQEGQAELFAGARYAELRVAGDGERILIRMLGADFQPLGSSGNP